MLPKIAVLIPTLNEEKTIGKVIKSIPKNKLKDMGYDVEAFIIDGDSKDKTREIAKKLGAKIILEPKKGYGRAYITGFSKVLADIYVTADADDTYPIKIIEVVIPYMEKYKLDFINTNRFKKYERGAWPPINKVGNKLLTYLTILLYGIRIKDSQSGMWFIRRDLLKNLKVYGTGMEFSVEIKIELIKKTKRWLEIPIYYKRRRHGSTKVHWFKDGVRILKFLLIKKITDFLN